MGTRLLRENRKSNMTFLIAVARFWLAARNLNSVCGSTGIGESLFHYWVYFITTFTYSWRTLQLGTKTMQNVMKYLIWRCMFLHSNMARIQFIICEVGVISLKQHRRLSLVVSGLSRQGLIESILKWVLISAKKSFIKDARRSLVLLLRHRKNAKLLYASSLYPIFWMPLFIVLTQPYLQPSYACICGCWVRHANHSFASHWAFGLVFDFFVVWNFAMHPQSFVLALYFVLQRCLI